MSFISRSVLMHFTDIELLEVILEDFMRANRAPFRNASGERPSYVDRALLSAYEVLPEGKSKRALEYVLNHPSAEFYFGGNDAVGPAIREGCNILKKKRLENGISKCDPIVYRQTA